MQGKESLSWFCRNWRGSMVVLVWGEDALRGFCDNRYRMKQKVLADVESPYQVIVFQGSSAHVTANEEHDWNGAPVLVMDVCNMDIPALNLLKRPGRTIWGIALPFWSHCITVGIQPELILGLSLVKLEQHELVMTELTQVGTGDTDQNKVCFSCFTHSVPELRSHIQCQHMQCTPCCALRKQCYHASHSREYVSLEILSASGLLFGDDDDDDNNWN